MKLIKLCLILSLAGSMLSCSPSKPYEIKSPCVTEDSVTSPYGIHPCPRRPVNLKGAIA